jgi:hypothetical protein
LPDEVRDGGEFLFFAGRWMERSGHQDHPQRDETTHEESPVGAIVFFPTSIGANSRRGCKRKN